MCSNPSTITMQWLVLPAGSSGMRRRLLSIAPKQVTLRLLCPFQRQSLHSPVTEVIIYHTLLSHFILKNPHVIGNYVCLRFFLFLLASRKTFSLLCHWAKSHTVGCFPGPTIYTLRGRAKAVRQPIWVLLLGNPPRAMWKAPFIPYLPQASFANLGLRIL